jgi:hypothetical protein
LDYTLKVTPNETARERLKTLRPRFPSYHSRESEYPADLLFERLRALDPNSGDYAVFGSGPLAIRGLIDRVGDLDIICRGAVWGRVKTLGTTIMYGENEVVDLGTGLTFGTSWGYGDFDVDQLIDDAETIEGLEFVRLGAVVEFKRIASRPKDLEHLRLMEDNGLLGAEDKGL